MPFSQRNTDQILYMIAGNPQYIAGSDWDQVIAKLSMDRLRIQTGLPKAELDAILEDLEEENRIIIRGKTVFLK